MLKDLKEQTSWIPLNGAAGANEMCFHLASILWPAECDEELSRSQCCQAPPPPTIIIYLNKRNKHTRSCLSVWVLFLFRFFIFFELKRFIYI